MYRISTRVAWQLLGRMGTTEEWRIDIYKEANRSVLSASSHQEVLLLVATLHRSYERIRLGQRSRRVVAEPLSLM